MSRVPAARLLSELERVADRLGIRVRIDAFGRGLLAGHGGLCWVKGRPLIVLDEALPLPDRIAVLASALATFDLGRVEVPAAVREAVEARRASPARTRRRGGGSRPGLARAKPRS